MIFDRKRQLSWSNHPFDIYLNQGRLVGHIRARGGCARVRGDYLKYLKRRWNRKGGRGNKDFRKRGQAGSRGGCLKKREAGTPFWIVYNDLKSPADFDTKSIIRRLFAFNFFFSWLVFQMLFKPWIQYPEQRQKYWIFVNNQCCYIFFNQNYYSKITWGTLQTHLE